MGMKRHNNDELLRTIWRHKKKRKKRGQRALHSQYDIQNYISFLKNHLWHLFNNQQNVNNLSLKWNSLLTQLVSVTKLKFLMGIDIYIIVTFSKAYCLSCIHSCTYGGNYWVKIYIIEFFIFLSRCWFERFFGITYQIKKMHFFNQ